MDCIYGVGIILVSGNNCLKFVKIYHLKWQGEYKNI